MSGWSGFLRKTETGVEARLSDSFGYITVITGIPATDEHGVKGYALTARTIIPDSLKLPFDDESTEPHS